MSKSIAESSKRQTSWSHVPNTREVTTRVARLNRELTQILALPEVRTAFESQGMDPASSTPEEFRHLVEQDADRWARLIKAQGITAD